MTTLEQNSLRSDWRSHSQLAAMSFRATGRAVVEHVLDPAAAAAAARALIVETGWSRLRSGSADSDALAYDAARAGNGRLLDRCDLTSEVTAKAASLLAGEPFGTLLGEVCGEPGRVRDVEGVRLLSGDFDSALEPRGTCGFVLDLTHDWPMEWGGLLLFSGAGDRVDALTPCFNRLAAFRAEPPPSVSLVSPAARTAAYSLRGWFGA